MSKETWIYLVRHGETDWNRQFRLQGHSDIPLNRRGREQAICLQNRLLALDIRAVYSSDLCRCLETASLSLGNGHRDAANDDLNAPSRLKMELCIGLTCRASTALRERCYGEWEGLTREEIHGRWPEFYEQWTSRAPGFCAPGAETNAALRSRMAAFLDQVLDVHRGERVVAFSHGGAILSAIGLALDMPSEQRLPLRLSNVSITGLSFSSGGWQLAFANDTCHLPGDE